MGAERGLQVIDLDQCEYFLLGKYELIPEDTWQRGEIFGFELLPQSEVPAFKRKAKTFMAPHCEGAAEADEAIRVVADVRDPYFGEVIPPDVVANSESMPEAGTRGLIEFQEEIRFVEQVGRSELAELLKKLRSATAMTEF